jgi:hypothetical protein
MKEKTLFSYLFTIHLLAALRGRHNDMLQFDFKATDLLTRELSPSRRWVIRSKGPVNDRVGTNSATMNNRGKDEKEKLDQSLESDIEASRNGACLSISLCL